jgi:hypothetical protein
MTQSEVVLDEVRLHPRRALFITLTCKGDLTAEQAKRGLSNFFRRLKRDGYDVSLYVVGREFQRRGVAHYHVLLFTDAYLSNDKVIGPAWRIGFTTTRAIDRQRAYYFAFKYLGKGCGATLHSSVGARLVYNAREVARWWHRVGVACWRYGVRMGEVCRELGDDSVLIRGASRVLWVECWEGVGG